MKYLATLFLLLLLIISTENLLAQWVPTSALYLGQINCFTVSGTNLFAGTYDMGVNLSNKIMDQVGLPSIMD